MYTLFKNRIRKVLLSLCLLVIVYTPNAWGFSAEYSDAPDTSSQNSENLQRTENIVKSVEKYMRDNDAYLGILSRRGAGDPRTGISDTDGFDLTGMAHSGFIVKNGLSPDANYITFNLVRQKGKKKTSTGQADLSELKLWTLQQFFIGSFEKDAIIFLPEKKVQLKLWNMLRSDKSLVVEEKLRLLKDKDGEQLLGREGKPRFIMDMVITGGMFTILHNPEYNLLSDYSEESTQNCNEHLLHTYIGFRDHWLAGNSDYKLEDMELKTQTQFQAAIQKAISSHFTPRQMVLSRTKSTFAFTQNIRFGERYKSSPTLLGLKLKKEKFDVVSVDSLSNPKNQGFLKWHDFKVLRENRSNQRGWFIEDWGRNYVKKNRLSGKENRIASM